MKNQPITRIMTAAPHTLSPDDALDKVEKLFHANGIHHAPVVDQGRLVGIVSDADFMKLHLIRDRAAYLDSIKVRQIMRANPICLSPVSNLRDAAEQLLQGGFHALPVVNGDTVVGIVTTTDLALYLLQHVERGDGSLSASPPADAGSDDSNILRMKAVCEAAERFIRSGHAAHEHSVLVKRLAELKDGGRLL